MLEELLLKIQKKESEYLFELTRVTDPYHLTGVLERYAEDVGHFYDEARQMRNELEAI